jgi:hypothetical protein
MRRVPGNQGGRVPSIGARRGHRSRLIRIAHSRILRELHALSRETVSTPRGPIRPLVSNTTHITPAGTAMANIGPANTPVPWQQIERGFSGWEVGIRKGHVSIEMDKKVGSIQCRRLNRSTFTSFGPKAFLLRAAPAVPPHAPQV